MRSREHFTYWLFNSGQSSPFLGPLRGASLTSRSVPLSRWDMIHISTSSVKLSHHLLVSYVHTIYSATPCFPLCLLLLGFICRAHLVNLSSVIICMSTIRVTLLPSTIFLCFHPPFTSLHSSSSFCRHESVYISQLTELFSATRFIRACLSVIANAHISWKQTETILFHF